ncbi:MAG: molybdenum cofactor sulfurase [Pseudomonadota bacterium]
MDIIPGFRMSGRVERLMKTFDDGFETAPVDGLELTFEGIPGDRHGGTTRGSGGREPWYTRGTEIRNERQITLLAPDELDTIAAGLGVDTVEAEWIGGNILLSGVPHLSHVPAGTLMFFENGVTLVVQAMNGPCRFSGAAIAKRHAGLPGLDLNFVKVAKRLRGLLAWVEKPGRIETGETVRLQVPEQWVFPKPA